MNKQEFLNHLDKCMESLSRCIDFKGRKAMIAGLAKLSSNVENSSSDKQIKRHLDFLNNFWCTLSQPCTSEYMVANMYKTLRDVYCGRV